MNGAAWQRRTIDSLCLRVTSGGTPSRRRAEFYRDGTIPWIKTGELRDRRIEDYDEYITSEGTQESAAKVLPPNTVLMAMYGATVGMLGILNEPAACNQASCAMIADQEQCDYRWLYYALLNDRARIVGRANGAAQQNLSGQTIKSLELMTPPVEEQRAIAEVLAALDDKIAANRRLARVSDDWVRASLDSLSPVGVKQIGELVESRREVINPSRIDPKVSYVGLEHIPRRHMWLDAEGSAGEVTSGKARFFAGDILFGKLRPNFHKVVSAPRDGICSTDVLVLRPRAIELAGTALAIVASDLVVASATSASEGTRMPRTSWKDLAAFEVPWPGDVAALKFSEKVLHLRASVEGKLQENETLAATRDALLPQLLSGNLRVRDAEKTLEEVL